jgi:hypothetical protein
MYDYLIMIFIPCRVRRQVLGWSNNVYNKDVSIAFVP